MVRGGDPDHVDVRVPAYAFNTVVRLPPEVTLEGLEGLRADVGCSHDLDSGLVTHHVEHAAARIADADDAEPQDRLVVR